MRYAISIIDSATTKGLGESPSTGGYEIAKHLKLVGGDTGQVGQRLYTVEQHIEAAAKEKLVCLGGDHLATHGLFQGSLRRWERKSANLLIIDAHDDCGAIHGGVIDASNWVGALYDDGAISNTVQLGMRRPCFKAPSVGDALELVKSGPTYISIDMDGFDPSIAPAVNWPVPGGLMAHTVLDLLAAIAKDKRMCNNVIGFDVCEYVPAYDSGKITASLAAHCVMAYTGGLVPAKPAQ